MYKCTKCDNKGYDHIIDMQGQHYDITETGMAIFRSLFDTKREHCLCDDCAYEMEKEHGVQYVRNYLHMKIN